MTTNRTEDDVAIGELTARRTPLLERIAALFARPPYGPSRRRSRTAKGER